MGTNGGAGATDSTTEERRPQSVRRVLLDRAESGHEPWRLKTESCEQHPAPVRALEHIQPWLQRRAPSWPSAFRKGREDLARASLLRSGHGSLEVSLLRHRT